MPEARRSAPVQGGTRLFQAGLSRRAAYAGLEDPLLPTLGFLGAGSTPFTPSVTMIGILVNHGEVISPSSPPRRGLWAKGYAAFAAVQYVLLRLSLYSSRFRNGDSPVWKAPGDLPGRGKCHPSGRWRRLSGDRSAIRAGRASTGRAGPGRSSSLTHRPRGFLREPPEPLVDGYHLVDAVHRTAHTLGAVPAAEGHLPANECFLDGVE